MARLQLTVHLMMTGSGIPIWADAACKKSVLVFLPHFVPFALVRLIVRAPSPVLVRVESGRINLCIDIISLPHCSVSPDSANTIYSACEGGTCVA